MKTDIILCPSILSADFSRLGEEIARLERAGADMIHIDVMDGDFVPNITIGPPVIKRLRELTKLPFDVHLMITQPDRHLGAFAEAGADIITVHAEACTHLSRTLGHIRALGAKPSVALNPHTPLDFVRWVIGDATMVLVMTVNPGFGGQSFIDAMYGKVAAVRAMADDAGIPIDIEVDGGVNSQNIEKVFRAGANVIVAGSAVFHAADMRAELESYRTAAKAAARSAIL
ncbi:MAG: ribulose-phosphate 3-epimerase [Oscillospiraceae bacterium]|nr:ribulose-phosphate 3-epimerase [Oscillospiraceae bacterium]